MARKIPFDEQLRRAIAQSEFTRYRICKTTGISQPNLSRFARRHAGLSVAGINKLVDFLDLELVPRKKGR